MATFAAVLAAYAAGYITCKVRGPQISADLTKIVHNGWVYVKSHLNLPVPPPPAA